MPYKVVSKSAQNYTEYINNYYKNLKSWWYVYLQYQYTTAVMGIDETIEVSITFPSWVSFTFDDSLMSSTNYSITSITSGNSITVTIIPHNKSTSSTYVQLMFNLALKDALIHNETVRIGIADDDYPSSDTATFSTQYLTRPQITFDPYFLDFGNVNLNEPVTKNITFTIENAYTTSSSFVGNLSGQEYDHSNLKISTLTASNATKLFSFTYNSVTYTTYTLNMPIVLTPKYFGQQEYRVLFSYYGWYNNDNTSRTVNMYAFVDANVVTQIGESSTGGDGKIYLGNILLADSSNSLPIGAIIMFYGSTSNIPDGWALCDGKTYNGITTPNLTDRFIIGCSIHNPVGKVGGTINSIKDALIDSLNQNYFSKINLSHYHKINFKYWSDFGDNANTRPVPSTTGSTSDFGTSSVFTSYEWSSTSTSSGSRLSFGSDNPTKFPLPAFYALAFIMKIS